MSKKNYYEVPVYIIDWENETVDVQAIAKEETDEVSEYISVEHLHPDNEDAELEVVHEKPDGTHPYRFRIRDEDLRECEYRGDDLDDVPIPVQRAVAASDYGITGLCRRDNPLFLWMQGNELLEATKPVEKRLRKIPVMDAGLKSVINEMDTLTLFTLAKFTLSPETYWDCWQDVAGQPAVLNAETLERLGDRFLTEIAETDADLIIDDDDSNEIPALLNTDTVRRGDDEYLLMDAITKWGTYRFRFNIQSDDECIYEGPVEVRVPPFVKHAVKLCGYEIGNRPDMVQTNTPSQNLRQYVKWCHRVESIDLIPDETTGPLADPIRQSRRDAEVMAALLEFCEAEPKAAARIHKLVGEKHDVRRPEEISKMQLGTMAAEILQRMPNRYHPRR